MLLQCCRLKNLHISLITYVYSNNSLHCCFFYHKESSQCHSENFEIGSAASTVSNWKGGWEKNERKPWKSVRPILITFLNNSCSFSDFFLLRSAHVALFQCEYFVVVFCGAVNFARVRVLYGGPSKLEGDEVLVVLVGQHDVVALGGYFAGGYVASGGVNCHQIA